MTEEASQAASHRIHGHEVMEMMLAAERGLTRGELVSAIVERFGPAARFHTCSADGLTATEIVEFLESRGKFLESGGKLTTSPDRICAHDGEHAHE